MQLEVLKTDGSKSGRKVTLPKTYFGVEPNDHAIYLAVKQYMANQRQGTHKTKEKGEVSGSTKKLHRQKGTGGARVGSIKSPLFPGGGRVFGPKPRDYSFKLNKKVKEIARNSALTYKAKDKSISIIENFKLEDNKTKNYFQILKNLGLSDKRTLMVVNQVDENLMLATRNIQRSSVARVTDLNTHDILHAHSLVFTEESLKHFEN